MGSRLAQLLIHVHTLTSHAYLLDEWMDAKEDTVHTLQTYNDICISNGRYTVTLRSPSTQTLKP